MIETIPIFLVGYAAGELGEAMADRMTDSRGVTTRASAPIRTLDPTPVIPPNVNTGTPSPRTVSTRAPIYRGGSGPRSFAPVGSTAASGSGSASGESGSEAKSPYFYDVNDRLGLLADLFLRTFGGTDPLQGTTQYSVVPQQVGGSSGGSNIGLMLLVLGLAGVGIWYFYYR